MLFRGQVYALRVLSIYLLLCGVKGLWNRGVSGTLIGLLEKRERGAEERNGRERLKGRSLAPVG